MRYLNHIYDGRETTGCAAYQIMKNYLEIQSQIPDEDMEAFSMVCCVMFR